jgi:hypothetical protein
MNLLPAILALPIALTLTGQSATTVERPFRTGAGQSGQTGLPAQAVAPATGSLSGVVQDLHGAPVAGAEVACWTKSTGTLRAKSDASGRYEVLTVPTGTRTLTISVRSDSIWIEGVEVRADETTAVPTIRMPCRCGRPAFNWVRKETGADPSLGGLQVDVREAPYGPDISGAVLTLRSAGSKATLQSATTNRTGRHVFANLPPGYYDMRIEYPGSASEEREGFLVQAGFTAVYAPTGLLPCSTGACARARERILPVACPQLRHTALSFLRSRNVVPTDQTCSECVRLHSVDDGMRDASGKRIDSSRRAARLYGSTGTSWFILYGAPSLSGSIRFFDEESGCRVKLEMEFGTYAVLIIPIDGDAVGFGSNHRLESEYLDQLVRRIQTAY